MSNIENQQLCQCYLNDNMLELIAKIVSGMMTELHIFPINLFEIVCNIVVFYKFYN